MISHVSETEPNAFRPDMDDVSSVQMAAFVSAKVRGKDPAGVARSSSTRGLPLQAAKGASDWMTHRFFSRLEENELKAEIPTR